jgi:hypothetical protein
MMAMNGAAVSGAMETVRKAVNDNRSNAGSVWRRDLSALPPDASAVIEPANGGANQAGRARKSRWRLWFKPRVRPSADPLTGWAGGGDPLAHLELSFRRPADAIAYCRRHGIDHVVRGQCATSATPLRSKELDGDRTGDDRIQSQEGHYATAA